MVATQPVQNPASAHAEPHPFLKWAGGKGQLLEQYRSFFPRRFRRYFEPFLGGGAVFFRLRPRDATLSDINSELIDCYRAVRDRVDDVVRALGTHRYEESYYYAIRDLDPDDLDPAERAARTIYLNQTGFNGLYRVNREGRFNVPFGRHSNPTICNKQNLRACSRALFHVRIEARGYLSVRREAERGDFVYFDPPYVPLSGTANFTSYSADGFGEFDQERLGKLLAQLDANGVKVMVSNSDTPEVRELYRGLRLERVRARRKINSDPNARGPVGELVARNYR